MKKIYIAASMMLCSLSAGAQDEPVAAEADVSAVPATSVWNDMAERFYVSPMFSYSFVDSGRNVEAGLGGALAVGRAFGPFGVELAAQYAKHDHESGAGAAKVQSLGANVLFFPSKKRPGYVLLGAGYGDVQDHPGGVTDYNPLMLNLGGGYWWQPFEHWLPDLLLRTEAVYRLDAHNDKRTGETVRNGRKDFNDLLLNVGLVIPVGGKPAPMVPPPAVPEPVAVVPVLDADGDAVADDTDQCPDTVAGGTVDAAGCTAAPEADAAAAEPAPACKAHEPGSTLDLSACKAGDVVVLKGVNFEFNQARLTPAAEGTVAEVSAALAASSASVEIAGHTDAVGSEDYNRRLSQRRACTVARKLVDGGVAGERLSPVGYGGSNPVTDNETEEGRAQNRRVALKLIDGPSAGLQFCKDERPAPVHRRSAASPVAESEIASDAAPAEPETPVAVEPGSVPAQEAIDAATVPATPKEASTPAVAETPQGTDSPTQAPGAVEMVPEEEVFGR